MSPVELVADTNVVSYIYNETQLGLAYEELIGPRRVGITGHTIAELRAGVFMAVTLHDEWEIREADRGVYEGGPLLSNAGRVRDLRVRATPQ